MNKQYKIKYRENKEKIGIHIIITPNADKTIHKLYDFEQYNPIDIEILDINKIK